MAVPYQTMKDLWSNSKTNSSFVIASPNEVQNSQTCTQEGVSAGVQAAVATGAVTAVPVLVGCRFIPWAKANLNYTAQALIISAASVAAFFITADKTILERARKNAPYDRRI